MSGTSDTRARLAGPSLLVLCAFALWFFILVVRAGSFWAKIAVSSSFLAASALAGMGGRRRGLVRLRVADAVLGLASAGLLYGVFVLGKAILTAILSRAAADISLVYAPRGSLPLWAIGVLLFAVTGPAEEIFWRGYLQSVAVGRIGKVGGLLVTSGLYALVHLCTLNLPLVLAALTAGLAWGSLYLWRRNLLAPIVSHATWGLLIFVLFPVA